MRSKGMTAPRTSTLTAPRGGRSRARETGPERGVRGYGADVLPYVGLAALSLVQAWEWLFSGLSKLQNQSFVNGFTEYVSHTRGAYGQLLRTVVMGGPMLVPKFVELSELSIGILLLVASGALLVPVRRIRLTGVVAAGLASMVGATIAINVQLTLGGRAPWRLSMAPFGPGVPIEALLAGVSLAAFVQAYASFRQARAAGARSA